METKLISSLVESASLHQRLPTEVWENILSYLSLRDRKNVRLSNRYLYDVCRTKKFLVKEKFVITCCYSVEAVYKTLTSCNYQHLNLEFHCVILTELPENFWIAVGTKIITIDCFNGCKVDSETCKNIVTYCDNLQYLRLELVDLDDFFLFETKFIYEMWANQVIHKNLIHLSIITDHSIRNEINYSNVWFPRPISSPLAALQMWLIFPNMKHCDLYDISEYQDFSKSCHDLRNNKGISKEWLTSTGESLVFSGCPCCFESIVNTKNSRLKRFEATVNCLGSIVDNLCQLIFNNQLLETVRLTLRRLMIPSRRLRKFAPSDRFMTPVKNLLILSIKICPKLQEFRCQIDSYLPASFCYDDLVTILNSTLKHLEIRFNFNFVKSAAYPVLTPNEHLHTLVLNASSFETADDYHCVFILQHFRNLKHLEIYEVREVVLQAVFKYLPELLCLKISAPDKVDDSFLGCEKMEENVPDLLKPEKYSIAHLKSLQCLSIDFRDRRRNLSEIVLSNFVFPQLKHFQLLNCAYEVQKKRKLEFKIEISLDLLNTLAENSPYLEILEFDSVFPLQELSKVCEKLRNLSFLEYCEPVTLEHENLFKICPSLRILAQKGRAVGFYNPFINNITMIYWIKKFSYSVIKEKLLKNRCCFELAVSEPMI